jgi:hypothetical protein
MSPIRRTKRIKHTLSLTTTSRPNISSNISTTRGRNNKRGTTIMRIRPTRNKPLGLKPIQHLGSGPRRDVQMRGQLRRPHSRMTQQHPQRTKLRRSQVPPSQRLSGRLTQQASDRPDRVGQRVVPIAARLRTHRE